MDAGLGYCAVEVRLMSRRAVSFHGQRSHAVKEVDLINCNAVRIRVTSVDKGEANFKVVSVPSNAYFYLCPNTIKGDIHANGVEHGGELQLLVEKNWSYDGIHPGEEQVEVKVAR